MTMKTFFPVLAILFGCVLAIAEDKRPPKGFLPNLTPIQQQCLQKHMKPPKEGERPSREAMQKAFSKCKIKMPQPPAGGHKLPPPPPEEGSDVGQ